MEAKGCAIPTVWNNARRYFYWAVRARLAHENAIRKLIAASPGTPEDILNTHLLQLVAAPETEHQAFTLEMEALELSEVAAKYRSAHITRSLVELIEENRKEGLAGMVKALEVLSEDERGILLGALQGTKTPGT